MVFGIDLFDSSAAWGMHDPLRPWRRPQPIYMYPERVGHGNIVGTKYSRLPWKENMRYRSTDSNRHWENGVLKKSDSDYSYEIPIHVTDNKTRQCKVLGERKTTEEESDQSSDSDEEFFVNEGKAKNVQSQQSNKSEVGPDVEYLGESQVEVDKRKARTFEQITEDLTSGDLLTDESINLAQNLLHRQFPEMGGLEDTVLGPVMNFSAQDTDFVQILHDLSCHWVCVSNIGCEPGMVKLYDSLNGGVVKDSIRRQVAVLMHGVDASSIEVQIEPVQRQPNAKDCGVFAIAFATSLLFGEDPSSMTYDVGRMRHHLLFSLEDGELFPFPKDKSSASSAYNYLFGPGRIKANSVTFPLMCWCRMPQSENQDKADVIECDSCGEFYHTDCENIPTELLQYKYGQWFCSACR